MKNVLSKENRNNQRGFTLAELLIVVAIIAVLMAVAIPTFTGQLEKTKVATDHANIRAAYAYKAIGELTGELEADGGTTKKDGTYFFTKSGALASVDGNNIATDAYLLKATDADHAKGKICKLQGITNHLNDHKEGVAIYIIKKDDKWTFSLGNSGTPTDPDGTPSPDGWFDYTLRGDPNNESHEAVINGLSNEWKSTDTDIVIPSDIKGYPVTTIEYSAFSNRGLTSVSIPDTMLMIGTQAFSNNKLTMVTVPDSVNNMADYVFINNPKLVKIEVIGGVDSKSFSAVWNNKNNTNSDKYVTIDTN